MRILVTGGGGFIGSHVARRLAEDGHEVTRLVRRRPVLDSGAGRWHVGDLEGAASCEDGFRGQDAIVHCAGPTETLHGHAEAADRGARATTQALAYAAQAEAGRFVHLSSLAVCSPPRPRWQLDERSPLADHPTWNRYARIKTDEERAVRAAHGSGGMATVVLRPGITFGPGDPHATPLFHAALSLPVPFLVGSGNNPVAALAVEDLADAVALAVTQPGIEGRCYALAADDHMTQRDLFRMHAREYRLPAPRWHIPLRTALGLAALTEHRYRNSGADPPVTRIGIWVIGSRSAVDTSRAALDLGWRGGRSIEDAIGRSIAGASPAGGAS